MRKLFFLFLSLTFWLGTCAPDTAVPEVECLALVALYQSTNGANWLNQQGWLTDNDVCSWHGVTCTNGRVMALELGGNNLVGTIPPDIGNLNQLTYYENTAVCAPGDEAFQTWLLSVNSHAGTGLICD